MDMKALSLTQPMAWAIFHGKKVENRRWSTKVRGRVYIHASKGFNKGHYRLLASYSLQCLLDEPLPEPEDFVHGAIIGEVDIVDCVFYPPDDLASLHSPWAMPGQYGFILANAVEYEKPIPCKGMLRFFEVSITDIERRLADKCTEENPCCDRRNEYNGFASGPTIFECPKHCSCHD